jgi:hypothetical protein
MFFYQYSIYVKGGKMKPILFNTEMVQAILDGRKTVTRRLVKEKIIKGFDYKCDGTPWYYINEKEECWEVEDVGPYQVGDIIYVRETFADTWTPGDDTGYVYKADGQPNSFPYWGNASTCKDEVWRPSLHMPKEAARMFLKVTNVRVEKLQDISCTQAEMEGVSSTVYWTPKEMDNKPFEEKWWDDYHFWTHYPQIAFSRLWDSTLSKSDIVKYSWEANPWVWVIEFEPISKEEAH